MVGPELVATLTRILAKHSKEPPDAPDVRPEDRFDGVRRVVVVTVRFPGPGGSSSSARSCPRCWPSAG